jgi:hypothetical protein
VWRTLRRGGARCNAVAEYALAEMGNTVECKTNVEEPLSLALTNSYAQLNEFNWSNA